MESSAPPTASTAATTNATSSGSITSSQESLLGSLLPKKETRADTFLKSFPNYDGRNVKVAIFDTGVDPGSIGLQKTNDGRPKIADLIDCTGCGDVPLSPVSRDDIKVVGDAYQFTGPSGRLLKVPTKYVESEGTWHVGLKRVFELWPKDLVGRIQKQRKEKLLESHQSYLAQAQNATPPKSASEAKPNGVAAKETQPAIDSKETEAQLAALDQLKSSYDDVGPILDCVVFRPEEGKGEQWALLDTSEQGTFEKDRPLHAYHHKQEWAVFSEESLMSYSVNFYDDVLSIVTCSGTHGTHVAGIVAAHFPDNPVLDGLAPGAQIVSMQIGDTRLSSLETSQSFMRAMSEAIRLKVDCINISFGEDSHLANCGPVMDYMRDKVIRKHYITVVSSAGNNGPGYGTIGAPGGMTTDIVGVGAYVSKDMAAAMYGLRAQAGDSAYTWSSRGPSIDGDVGVSLFAPGAAVTCVPPYALNHSQLMNGTSMSSPNACGNIALLISALKQEKKAYSPGSIKRALLRTVRDVGDEFKTGMLDVEAAYHDLTAGEAVDPEFYVDLVVDGKKRGIIVREDVVSVHNVEIKPFFRQEATRKKFDLELYLSLKAGSGIKTAEFITLNNTGRVLQVEIDPSSLAEGLHITSIDAIAKDKKVFSIPVTIVKPKAIERHHAIDKLAFQSGHIERRYLAIPDGTTGATITVHSRDIKTPVQIWGSVTQFLPQRRRTQTSWAFATNLNDSEQASDFKKTFTLQGGVVAEFCFAQFWSSISGHAVELDVAIELHGLKSDDVVLTGATGYTTVLAKSHLGTEDFKPSARLEMLRRHLRPKDQTLLALPDRDRLESTEQLFQLVLQYAVKFESGCEARVVLPNSDTLYENPFYSTFYAAYDERKNLVHFGSTYPDSRKFEKGSYTVVVELVHRDRSVLDKLQSSFLLAVDSKLEKPIELSLHDSFLQVWSGPKAEFKNEKLAKGKLRSFAISNDCDLPKEAAAGDLLLGSLTLGAHKELKQRLRLVVPPAKPAKKSASASAAVQAQAEEKPDPKRKLLDLKIELAAKITDTKEKVAYLEELRKDEPTDLASLGALMEAVEDPTEALLSAAVPTATAATAAAAATAGSDAKAPATDAAEATAMTSVAPTAEQSAQLDTLDRLANSIIDLVQPPELAAYFGTRQDGTADLADDELSSQQRTRRNDMRARKEWLAKALDKKLRVQLVRAEKAEQVDDLEYLKWTDSSSSAGGAGGGAGAGAGAGGAKALLLKARLFERQHKLGRAVKAALDAVKAAKEQGKLDTTYDAATKVRNHLLQRLGWTVWAEHFHDAAIGRDPKCFRGF